LTLPLTLEATVAANLAEVRHKLAEATRIPGRDPHSVRLVAVSKTYGLGHVRAAVVAGHRDFGENRVQEAMQKIAGWTGIPLRWHLVGHLQSNKARRAAAAFACIHSIDDVELLRRVDSASSELGTRPELLVQVDLAGEPTKHGAPAEAAIEIFEAAASCKAARVTGLMLMPPFTEDPEGARPYFRRLRELRDELAAGGVESGMLRELSMGMSHDFHVAVQEGATMVRVGTAIFGSRHP
jgi:PLP dependent protein